jgi:MFS transporter, MFS domain-containing protein family, molybdate-anion transporter
MWVPTLLSQNPPGGVPTGCVFSSLMIAITMGGVVFTPLHAFITYLTSKSIGSEVTASLIYFVASISMAIPATCLSGFLDGDCFRNIIVAFLVMEFCVGLFMPVAGTLRSKYVPDSLQGAILNIFRLPLNAIVVAGTHATDVLDHSVVFSLVSTCLFLAALLQASMIIGSERKSKKD